jgi:N-methylhydantoinase A/oxoprolinase/acetone carboxylase beta subunit
MDTLHIYEEFNPIRIFNGQGEYLNDFTEFNNTIDKMEKVALRDMRGEGFQPKDVKFRLDLETRIGSTLKHYIPSPILRIRKKEDIHTILREIPGHDKKPVWIELFSLKAISQMPRYKLPTYKKSKKDPRKAFKRNRDVWWKDGMEKTSVYEQKRLHCGNIIDGPAIIESEDTTHVIPERWKCTVDKYLNLQIRKRS